MLEGGGRRLELRRSATFDVAEASTVVLAGEWRVAELNGEDIGKPYPIALSANGQRIWWEPSCALQYRIYNIQGQRFTVSPPAPSTSAVCDIAIPDELPRIWAALESADTIKLTPANGIRISGGRLSVTLFSQ